MNIEEDLLPKNQFSRPGKALDRVMAVVIHYLGKPGQSARVARQYWASLASQDAADARPDISASAHYIVDANGTILRTLPESEKGYHCGSPIYTDQAKAFFGDYCTKDSSPNRVTIGVELAHFDWTGKPSPETEDATVELVRDLCARYALSPMHAVWRHYDVTGKDCPHYFVTYPNEWARFLERLV